MNWVSDLVSAMSLMVERGARSGAADFGTYMDETLGFWARLCESRGLKLSVNGEVPALPDSLHLPLALVLHEIMGEVVRHYEPGVVGQAAAVAFAASATDVSMVVSATNPPADDAVHAESMALVEGLAALLGGQATRSAPGRGGLTVKVHLPLATRQLQ